MTDAARANETAQKQLTPKQALFVLEYLVDLNATQAAIRAGYSAKTAAEIGKENLTKPQIAEAVRKAQDERAARLKIDADEILRELTIIARSDVRDFLVDEHGILTLRDEAEDHKWRAVQSVKHKIRTIRNGDESETTREIEFRMWPKVEALRTAREHLGLNIQKVELSGNLNGGVLVVPGTQNEAEWEDAAIAEQQALAEEKTRLAKEYGVD